MRNLAFLSILLLGGWAFSNARAECQLLACDSFSWYEPNEYIQAQENGTQCWGCGPGPKSCGGGDVVPQVNEHGEVISLYQCSYTFVGTGTWDLANPGNLCSDSPIKTAMATNTKIIYKEVGSPTTQINVGDFRYHSGMAFCKYISCQDGYLANSENTNCVRDTRASDCTASFGTWANNLCTCDAAKHLKLKNGQCVCESNRYRKDDTTRSCVLTDAARQEDEQNAQRTVQQRCENSGGMWQNNGCACPAANGLKNANGVCVCLDNNYRRSGNRCVLTDTAALKKECEKAVSQGVEVYWDDATKNCVCREANKEFRGGQCETSQAIVDCQSIDGAEWRGGGCYCVRDNYEIKNGKCVESDSSLQQARLEISKTQISKSASALNNIKNNFDISRWKNEEGKFNTARLASDSIAGVVLGTAGGLITSNVIKKNQVNNGFDDIQCTIGGQVVAGWGDQFTVGIR